MDGLLVETTGQCKQRMDIAHEYTRGTHALVLTVANTGVVLGLVNRPADRPSHEGGADEGTAPQPSASAAASASSKPTACQGLLKGVTGPFHSAGWVGERHSSSAAASSPDRVSSCSDPRKRTLHAGASAAEVSTTDAMCSRLTHRFLPSLRNFTFMALSFLETCSPSLWPEPSASRL
jgi:hypothetical protein